MAEPSGTFCRLSIIQWRKASSSGFCAQLSLALALVRGHDFELSLNLVDGRYLLQGAAGERALVGHMQVKELAPRVRQAAGLGDALGKAGFVAAEDVAHQAGAPRPQEGPGVLAGAAVAEVAVTPLMSSNAPVSLSFSAWLWRSSVSSRVAPSRSCAALKISKGGCSITLAVTVPKARVMHDGRMPRLANAGPIGACLRSPISPR